MDKSRQELPERPTAPPPPPPPGILQAPPGPRRPSPRSPKEPGLAPAQGKQLWPLPTRPLASASLLLSLSLSPSLTCPPAAPPPQAATPTPAEEKEARLPTSAAGDRRRPLSMRPLARAGSAPLHSTLRVLPRSASKGDVIAPGDKDTPLNAVSAQMIIIDLKLQDGGQRTT
ncbi:proline-rich receptor-like protein kinase PERK2 [Trichosurus vulpecula]|uniref:proline-rich receptor-like protein kinase PERK2 n=1 Tax=Trichosurus vulpecula TaxID=9337 RepID=UPI00186AD741|nr:proline-rich receptor-like protein kinase PERK2 [Trichosurus vulpecula]